MFHRPLKALVFFLFIIALLMTRDAFARGGKPLYNFQSGYSFMDVISKDFQHNYGWNYAEVVAPARAVFMGTTQPSRYPNSTIMWTVLSTDQPVVGCVTNCHNRNEFSNIFFPLHTDEVNGTGPFYYGMSMYVPSSTAFADGSTTGGFFWNIPLQLHSPISPAQCAGISPSLAISFSSSNPSGIPANHGILTLLGGECTSPTQTDIDLGVLPRNQWIDVVLQVTWGINSSASTAIYTRVNMVGTLQQVQFDGVTPIPTSHGPNFYSVSGVAATGPYWKHGGYTNLSLNTWVYYSSPFIRTSNFNDAVLGSTGTYP